jgi:hypothetical protein
VAFWEKYESAGLFYDIRKNESNFGFPSSSGFIQIWKTQNVVCHLQTCMRGHAFRMRIQCGFNVCALNLCEDSKIAQIKPAHTFPVLQ